MPRGTLYLGEDGLIESVEWVDKPSAVDGLREALRGDTPESERASDNPQVPAPSTIGADAAAAAIDSGAAPEVSRPSLATAPDATHPASEQTPDAETTDDDAPEADDDLDGKTKAELLEVADGLGLTGLKSKKNEEIIAAIEAAQSEPDTSPSVDED